MVAAERGKGIHIDALAVEMYRHDDARTVTLQDLLGRGQSVELGR